MNLKELFYNFYKKLGNPQEVIVTEKDLVEVLNNLKNNDIILENRFAFDNYIQMLTSGSFVVPNYVNKIFFEASAGGGSGSRGAPSINLSQDNILSQDHTRTLNYLFCGAGGGAGEVRQGLLSVVPGSTLNVVIGAGGLALADPTALTVNGNDGGDTTVSSTNGTLVLCRGGQGGRACVIANSFVPGGGGFTGRIPWGGLSRTSPESTGGYLKSLSHGYPGIAFMSNINNVGIFSAKEFVRLRSYPGAGGGQYGGVPFHPLYNVFTYAGPLYASPSQSIGKLGSGGAGSFGTGEYPDGDSLYTNISGAGGNGYFRIWY